MSSCFDHSELNSEFIFIFGLLVGLANQKSVAGTDNLAAILFKVNHVVKGIDQNHFTIESGEIKKAILDNLYYVQGRSPEIATLNDWYMAVAYTLRGRMLSGWIPSLKKLHRSGEKMVGYLSAEFLVGPHLGNALVNLGLHDAVKHAVESLGLDFSKLLHQEEEPGLGNGGLGRLAACYLDSLASLKVPAIGYGIRYEFGMFEQRIKHGEQVEVADKWLRFGNPWEFPQTEVAYAVKFGGHTEAITDDDGNYHVNWLPDYEVKGVAYDTPVPGYKNDHISFLRLWKSEAVESFDFSEFNRGNYEAAVNEKIRAESISKVLYPNDEPEAGKRLRLSQQYFFVSCSLQDAIHMQKLRGHPVNKLHEHVALQLNDTHPSVAIAELMRLLVDEHQFEWVEAWQVTQQVFSYTNHTLLPEALETWPMYLFQSLLPRHLEIIFEINQRFLDAVKEQFPGDNELLSRLSIIDETGGKAIRMAHLASVGSHHINGVSALHTALLTKEVLHDFNTITPEKFLNITNGVTPRRWILQYNPGLSALLTEHLGDSWVTHLETNLEKLSKLADDAAFQKRWKEIKHQNKRALADQLIVTTGVLVNPDTLFEIQAKRIHEYKRQHLSLLHIITRYNRIKKNPKLEVVPRTYIFGGKAAPGYFLARMIIKLINAIAAVINNDFDVAGRMKVVFYPDFNVKNSEWIYRAADLSVQISTAGKEASGTGNMKFAMNGALTIGTLDGANVEMREAVGNENFFLFGLSSAEVAAMQSKGYRPRDYYEQHAELREAIDTIQQGIFSGGDGKVFQPLVDSLLNQDPYLVLADYEAFVKCQENVDAIYLQQEKWLMMSILNVAAMGYFSSDRSVREYCEKIWNVKLSKD
ncbi:MAG: glycogen/starch/alpha-glucan phosphorylase [Chitinophagales bacterium]|nr:glycogen/starch/alpha-glucan phosphorylase [Chitinophagales bacterium]